LCREQICRIYSRDSTNRNHTKVDWSKFALRLYNKFAREREISGVAIANHILQQPTFFLPLGEQKKVNINLFWVRYEVTRIAALCRESELLEELEETGENQYTTFAANSGQPTTIYDKYRYRGSELQELCLGLESSIKDSLSSLA
jgi:hypothetical protein